MDNNFNNQSNNPTGGFGTSPNNFNTNQNNTQNGWESILDKNTHQNTSNTNPVSNSYGDKSGFNPNTNYSNQNGYSPYQTYNNNLHNQNQQNYTAQPFNANQNMYANQQLNNGQNMYSNQQYNNGQYMYTNQTVQTGADPNKGKANSSLVLGIISCSLLFISFFLFWAAVVCAPTTVQDPPTEPTFSNVGIIISLIIPFVALILGIIGTVLGALYLKKSKEINVYTNKGKAILALVFSVAGTVISFISTFSCVACVSCSAWMYSEYDGEFDNGSYFYEYDDFDDYDDYDDYDDFDDFL